MSKNRLMWAVSAGLVMAPSLAQAYPYYYAPAPAPVYRTAPAYASPNAAALAPWAWNFNFGGGPTPVVGSSRNDINNGYNFTVGGGYNFSPRLGFVLEFMNGGFGVTDKNLENNQAVDGDAFVRSVTLNPIWRFRISGPVGGYLIGGGGFYEREERFTQPVTFFVPTRSGGFEGSGFADEHLYDDTGGVNVGAGITWNVGWGTKFYVEARYHYMFTSGTPTQIIPVTFGFRW
jgi:hypothetical protein